MCQFTAVSFLLSGLHLDVEGGGRGRENNIDSIEDDTERGWNSLLWPLPVKYWCVVCS